VSVASGGLIGADVVAVMGAEDEGISGLLMTVIVEDEDTTDSGGGPDEVDAAILELDSSFVVKVTRLLGEASELDPFSSTVDKVVVATVVVSFLAVVGKIELYSVDVICSSFEVDVLDTIENMLVRPFAGMKTLLVRSFAGIPVLMIVDEEFEVMSLAGTVAAGLGATTNDMELFNVVVVELETSVSILFMAGVVELVRSLAGLAEEDVLSFAGRVEEVFWSLAGMEVEVVRSFAGRVGIVP